MRKLRNILLLTCVSLLFSSKVFADSIWINDMRSLFLSNNAIIYTINIRTFNSNDKNKDGIIEESAGEERGTFLNAINRLDELVALGVNTVDLLPVTPVGKIKALGTAGSLYAPSSFNEINPQFKSPNSSLSITEEMQKFIDECHKRQIRVIVDLPCCASYDLYLRSPELFVKDKNQNPVIPADWTDVRLLNAGSESQINMDVYNLYSEFIDLMVSLNVDGIRANVASTKPAAFWKKLIDETKGRNPQFLFLAETSPYSTSNIQVGSITQTPFNKLMDAGFDGYYGDYSNLKNWKTSSDLLAHVKSDLEIAKKSGGNRGVIGNFATHDQISPVLINGSQFSKLIIWLNTTLPLNAFYVDGFPTGDDYIYFWANKKAAVTFTDDDYYFVHRGQLDIFNFSRIPVGKHYDILQDFVVANKFKRLANNVLTKGDFVTLRTSSPSVFAYSRNFDQDSVIVVGNLDFRKTQKVQTYFHKINKDTPLIPIKISNNTPVITKGKIEATLSPGEIQVYYVSLMDSKK